MNSDVVVREAVMGDVCSLCALALAQPGMPQWTNEVYRRMIGDAHRTLLVAVHEDAIAGFIAVWQVMDEAEIELIVVASAWRRQGVGKALCEAATERARAGGGRRVWLEVRLGNEAARSFYTTMGFSVSGVRRNYYAAPLEDAINMRLEVE